VFGLTSSELENWTCCLRPASFSELGELGRRPYLSRMSASAKGSRLISLCGGCAEEMSRTGTEIDNIIPFVYEHIDKLPALSKPLKVAMEPGCTGERYRKQMKEILTRMGCEIVNKTDGCCGNKTLPMMDERETECKGADIIVVACPNCQKRYDAYEGGLPVLHLTELISYAAGDFSTLGFHKIRADI
jgi:heterodisulfide reductase subunit B